MRKAKYATVIEEGGLGEIGGSSITVQAWVSPFSTDDPDDVLKPG